MSSSPTIAQLTDRVLKFVEERDWNQYHNPRNLAMALSVEANELLELYLWCTDDGPQPMNSKRNHQVAGEAADIFICLVNCCHQADIDLAKALNEKLAVAGQKYPADRVRGRALKYNEYPEWQPEDED